MIDTGTIANLDIATQMNYFHNSNKQLASPSDQSVRETL